MDEKSLRALDLRRLLPLILLLAIGLLLPASAAANVSDVKVSDSFASDSAHSFQAAPTQDHTYIYFTPNVELGPADAITVKGPAGMSFSEDANYGIGVGGLSGSGYSAGGVAVSNGGRTLTLTMNSIFSAAVGQRVQLQISDATLPHTVGSYTVTVSTSKEPTDVTSAGFNITAGELEELVPSGGDAQSATVGAAFADPLEVTAQDQYDNPIGGLDVTFAAPESDPSGTFGDEDATSTVATTGSDGVATSETLKANTVAGTWSATATAGTEEAGFSLTNDPGVAAALSISGGGQTTIAGDAFDDPVTATVTDSYGNGVPGVAVLFSNPCGGGCGRFADGQSLVTTATTDATGTASSGTITAGNLGWSSPEKPYDAWPLTISAGLGEALNETVTLTNIPGPVDHFVDMTGFQEAGVGEPFKPARVQANDRMGNPVAGVKVTFTAPTEGASTSTSFSEQTTDGEGRASSGPFAANLHAGFWQLQISADVPDVDTTMTLQNIADVPAQATISLDPTSLPADGMSTSEATITVADQYGNPLPQETVELTAEGPGELPFINPVTDNWDGTYSAEISASQTPGDFTVDATVDGYPAASGSATLKQLDIVAPTARITKQPNRRVKTKRKRAKVRFRFRADEPATFQCRLDRKRWKDCTSPLKLRLRKGLHTFRVRAVDSAGNRGPAARAKVRVVRKKQNRKRGGHKKGKRGKHKRR